MDTTPLIESLRQDLIRAAEVGGAEAKAAAERLTLALDPALRLTLMDALSQAAAEIGEALPGVSVEVRLKGREPEFVVVGAPAAPAADASFEAEEGEGVARITLRLPEALKARAEALAARRGQSLNTWLVGAARAAADDDHSPGYGRQGRGRRMQGWQR
jgi:HicB-like protein involved in pilus formation